MYTSYRHLGAMTENLVFWPKRKRADFGYVFFPSKLFRMCITSSADDYHTINCRRNAYTWLLLLLYFLYATTGFVVYVQLSLLSIKLDCIVWHARHVCTYFDYYTAVFRGIEMCSVNVYKYNWKTIKTNAHQCTHAAAQLRMRERSFLGIWTPPVPLSPGNVNRNLFFLKVNNNSNEIVFRILCLNVCITRYL